ncbi:hypothetical protein Glove_568g2 [Diversispora epigaea]|uniref:Uncharacterized protein n=1 Tax=Diversispora epigaea TaxID=1348612 RepID=A0A397G9P9_9GLOM|nr:hypothetical protein Glove_568g2 [Diversispora epigaea]
MWILFERNTEPTKLKADISKVTDLDDLKYKLTNEFNILKDVEPSKIVFFNYNYCSTPIRPGTPLQSLADNTTDTTPLIVRYPISDSSIVVKFGFLKKVEEKIEDEYSFMNLLTKTRPNELKERVLDLKVQTKGKKAFGDWSLKEVASEIYNNDFDKLDKEIEKIVDQLKTKASAFKNRIDTNEAPVREYVSIFMTQAVYHIQQYKDSTTTTLSVESELDGSRGYEKRKRKRDEQVDSNSLPPIMFDIVTRRFIRWFGTLQYPRAEITPSILSQADALEDGYNQDEERDYKKDEGN